MVESHLRDPCPPCCLRYLCFELLNLDRLAVCLFELISESYWISTANVDSFHLPLFLIDNCFWTVNMLGYPAFFLLGFWEVYWHCTVLQTVTCHRMDVSLLHAAFALDRSWRAEYIVHTEVMLKFASFSQVSEVSFQDMVQSWLWESVQWSFKNKIWSSDRLGFGCSL